MLIVVALIALGYLVFQVFTQQTSQTEEKINSDGRSKLQGTHDEANIPAGWINKADPKNNLTFAVPSEWGDDIKIQKYATSENIGIFQNIATVYINFSSDSRSWEIFTKQYGAPIKEASFSDISQLDITESDIKVEGEWLTVIYGQPPHTGPITQFHLFVVRNNDVFRFSLPTLDKTISSGTSIDGQPNFDDYKKRFHSVVKSNIPLFISTISFK